MISQGFCSGDRPRGKAFVVRRIVMLQHEMLAAHGAKGGHDGLPIDNAMADIGPAVFVLVLAHGGDVLDMGRGDAARILVDPRNRVRPAAHNPCYVQFNLQTWPPGKDRGLRDRPVGQRLEFEIVVVPACAVARRADGRKGLFQTRAERAPASGVGRGGHWA